MDIRHKEKVIEKHIDKFSNSFIVILLSILAAMIGIQFGNLWYKLDANLVGKIDAENFKNTINMSLPIIETVYNSGKSSVSVSGEIKELFTKVFDFDLDSPATILNVQSPIFMSYYRREYLKRLALLENTQGQPGESASGNNETADESIEQSSDGEGNRDGSGTMDAGQGKGESAGQHESTGSGQRESAGSGQADNTGGGQGGYAKTGREDSGTEKDGGSMGSGKDRTTGEGTGAGNADGGGTTVGNGREAGQGKDTGQRESTGQGEAANTGQGGTIKPGQGGAAKPGQGEITKPGQGGANGEGAGSVSFVDGKGQPPQPESSIYDPGTGSGAGNTPLKTNEQPVSSIAFEEEDEDEDDESNLVAMDKIVIRNFTKHRIDIPRLLREPLDLKFSKKGPRVLVYHTHTSESYVLKESDLGKKNVPSYNTNPKYNVVRVGEELARNLEKFGIDTLHNGTVHDKNRSAAYGVSINTLQSYKKSYPSIKVFIDIHRDGLEASKPKLRLTKEINGKKAAQIMFVVGADGMLPHPEWEENLKFVLKLQQKLNDKYPGLARPVWIVGKRYNQQISNNAVLIEVGGDGNLLSECLESTKYLAEALNDVMNGK